MKKLVIGTAIAALMQSGIAQAQQAKPCLAADQAEALVTYLLPKAVEAARSKCGAALPSTAELMAKNSERLMLYKTASEASWPMARQAINIIAADSMPPGLDDALIQPIVDAMFVQMIGQEIKSKQCVTINKVYTDLSPMPAANIASLVVTIIQASTVDDKKHSFPICKSPT